MLSLREALEEPTRDVLSYTSSFELSAFDATLRADVEMLRHGTLYFRMLIKCYGVSRFF
jgi:hypothetical protein